MSFESEFLLARLRGRGGRLLLPTLSLCISIFGLNYGMQLLHGAWQTYTLYGTCAVAALIGFLLPLLRYLASWTDITTARVVSRAGLWGQRYRSVSIANIQRVEQAGRTVTLYIQGEEAMDLVGLPKPKLVSQELSNLVAKSAPTLFSGGI